MQAKLSDMAIHAEAVRHFTYHVASLFNQGLDCHAEAAMVKTFGTEMATKACLDAFQIHGGYGFMHDYKVNRFFRETKMLKLVKVQMKSSAHCTVARMLIDHKPPRFPDARS